MNLNVAYEKLIAEPLNIIGKMSYDEYMDWLDMGSEKDLREALKKFECSNVPEDYIKIIKLRLI